jgi:hypothetical protein
MLTLIPEHLHRHAIIIVAAIKIDLLATPERKIIFDSMSYDVLPTPEKRKALIETITQRPYYLNSPSHNEQVFANYASVNFLEYVTPFQDSGITVSAIWAAKNDLDAEELSYYVKAVAGLRIIGFNPESMLDFLMGVNFAGLKNLPVQTFQIAEAMSPKSFFHYMKPFEKKPELESVIQAFLHPDKEIRYELDGIKKWWQHDELVTEKFRKKLTVQARYFRLQYEYTSTLQDPQFECYKKLLIELEMRELVDGKHTMVKLYKRHFLGALEADIDFYQLAEFQIENDLPITAIHAISQNTKYVNLTTDKESARKAIKELIARGILENHSSLREIKISTFLEDWPAIATSRVLNPDFSTEDYLTEAIHYHPPLILPPSSSRSQLGGRNTGLSFGLIEGTATILLSTVCLCFLYHNLYRMRQGWSERLTPTLRRIGLMSTSRLTVNAAAEFEVVDDRLTNGHVHNP